MLLLDWLVTDLCASYSEFPLVTYWYSLFSMLTNKSLVYAAHGLTSRHSPRQEHVAPASGQLTHKETTFVQWGRQRHNANHIWFQFTIWYMRSVHSSLLSNGSTYFLLICRKVLQMLTSCLILGGLILCSIWAFTSIWFSCTLNTLYNGLWIKYPYKIFFASL